MIDLAKGGKIDLSKEEPGSTKFELKLDWKPQTRVGEKFDLDVSVLVLGDAAPTDADFIFFKNPKHASGVVWLDQDDTDGNNGGETIYVDLDKMPADKNKLVFAINIDKAKARNQNYGQVMDSKATLIATNPTRKNVALADLGEDFSTEVCVIACEIYNRNGSYKYSNVAQGYATGLKGLLEDHGFGVGKDGQE